jgi:hypothetical protein
MTGFGHNAVSPLASATKLPIILSHKVLELDPPYMWYNAELSLLCSGSVYALLSCSFFSALAPVLEHIHIAPPHGHTPPSLTPFPYSRLGGGHTDLKWRVGVQEFIDKFDPIVCDITY